MKKIKIFLNYLNPFQNKYTFRNIKYSDYMVIFNWINEKSVRKNSLNQKLISLDVHKNWIKKKIEVEKDYFKFFCIKNVEIGFVRIDDNGDYYKLNYLLEKKFRGRNLSKIMIKMLLKDKNNYKHKPIIAEVLKSNYISINTLTSCGFKIYNDKKNNEIKKLIYNKL